MLGHGNRFVGGHLHSIGYRCWCEYLAVPARFHDRDDKGKVVGERGEKRYLAWLASDEKPEYVNPPVMEEIRRKAGARQAVEVAVTQATLKTCNACNEPFANRGKVCNRCRQAAYRRRHA